jgi:hypothetical protein
MTVPSEGSGTGGAGGIRLGGWLWVWGTPTYIMVIVAAGRLGKTFAMGAVRFAKPALIMSPTTPIPPRTPLTTDWTARALATACCAVVCGVGDGVGLTRLLTDD